MKNKFRLILCALLSASCVFAFAGCEKESSSGGDKLKEEGNPGEETVTAFLDALKDGKCQEMAKYVDGADEDDLPKDKEEIIEMSVEERMEDIPEEYAPYEDLVEAMAEEVVDIQYTAQFDSIEYEITESEEEDGKYICNVTMEALSGKSVKEKQQEVYQEKSTALQAELASGAISEEKEYVEKDIDAMIESTEEAVEEAETKERELEFVVIEKDGEWVIDPDESDVDDLADDESLWEKLGF